MADHGKRGQAPLRRLFYLGLCRLRGILSPPAPTTVILPAGRSSLQQRWRSRRAVLLCCNEEQNRTRKIVAATAVAGEPFSFAATKNRIGRGIRCRYDRCRRAILYRHDDCAASIPKSGLEIKNRCMKDGGNRQNPAVIRKFGLEIKNRCTKQPIFSTLPQQIPQHIPSTSPAHPTVRVHHAVKHASCLG